jgi:predicted GNAT superfamily acetyltransferase
VSAVISELVELEDLRALERLLAEVWGRPDEPQITSDTLRALAHSGNYVAGARVGDRLLGGLVGWYGGSPPDHLHLHSHILGVADGAEARGLGFDLKQHQRRWCLARGMNTIEWTFDPLVRRNAYFNLTKLGADADRYLVDFYGTMADSLNAGDESDRILVGWRLDSPKAEAAASSQAPEPDVPRLIEGGASVLLAAAAEGKPAPGGEPGGRIALCQVPEDIIAIRRADPALARSWRRLARQALLGALGSGYRVTACTRGGWYVLERS